MRRGMPFLGLITALVLTACAADRGAAGFALPGGDPYLGRVAFVDLQCHHCHAVSGADLPPPTVSPPVGVDLVTVSSKRSAGELVTAIIDPDHTIAVRWASGDKQEGGHSRMGNFREAMTVQQLVDIVAFLQAEDKPGEPVDTVSF